MLNSFTTEWRLGYQARPLLAKGWISPYKISDFSLFFISASAAVISLPFVLTIWGVFIFFLSIGVAIHFGRNIYARRLGLRILRYLRLAGFYDTDDTSRVNFVYKVENDVLKVAFSGQGRWGDKIQSLASQLQDLLGYPVIRESIITEGAGWYVYTLALIQPERYKIDNFAAFETLLHSFHRTEIPIDTQTTIDFHDTPHMLIAGQTGSGKTYFICWILMSLAKNHYDFSIIDAKSSDLSQLGQIIGSEKVATTAPQAAALLRGLSAEMDDRYRQLNNVSQFGADWREICLNPKFLVFDEVAALIAIADKKTAAEIMAYLKNIILKGRQAGIFVIISTQRPDAEALDTSIRDQLGVRIALGAMSPIGYSMVFGKNYDSINPVEGQGVGYCLIEGSGASQPLLIKTPSYELDVPELIKKQQKKL